MKVGVIGSSSRAHALVWKLANSNLVDEIIAIPGNGGTANHPKTRNIEGSSNEDIICIAESESIDLTIPCPESILAAGIVNDFNERGLNIWGPTKEAARLESDKSFAKEIMAANNIPTARWEAFTDYEEARNYLIEQEVPQVIKTTVLAAGKGVYVPVNKSEGLLALMNIFLDKKFGDEGCKVVIEDRIDGTELSVFGACDGEHVSIIGTAQDYKRLLEGDEGTNTGGTGSISPSPIYNKSICEMVTQDIFVPVLNAMKELSYESGLVECAYKGILYAGLIKDEKNDIYVLEFNCRFGCPEAETVLPLLNTDLIHLANHSNEGTLQTLLVDTKDKVAAGIVLMSGGYPGSYEVKYPIVGLDTLDDDILIFQGGTRIFEQYKRFEQRSERTLITFGGRVMTIVGIADTLKEALSKAYSNADRIKFKDKYYRNDIGAAYV